MRCIHFYLVCLVILVSTEVFASPYLIPAFRCVYQHYQVSKQASARMSLRMPQSLNFISAGDRWKTRNGKYSFQEFLGVVQGATQVEAKAPQLESIMADQPFDQPSKVVFYEQDSRSVWPRTVIRRRIKASPQQAVEIFSDFSKYKEFIPACADSTIKDSATIEGARENSIVVDYTFSLPYGLGKRRYLIQNQITFEEVTGAYGVSWERIQIPDSTGGEIEGNVQFIPEEDETLMVYSEIIIPTPSPFFNWARPTFVDGAKDIVVERAEALVDRIEREAKIRQESSQSTL